MTTRKLKKLKLKKLIWLFIALCLPLQSARAVLTIEITEGVEGALPMAIVPFAWEGANLPPREDVTAVIAGDLSRSGRFAPLPEEDLVARPHEAAQVNFQNWRIMGVDNLLIGKIRASSPGNYVVQFELFDVFKAKRLVGFNIPANDANLRYVAHQVSNIVYEALTGERGAFNTRIAYVTVNKKLMGPNKYFLYVADADGYNPREILASPRELISPSWSPDGQKLAYVSFEKNYSEIYIHDIRKGIRRRIARYPGHNGAPSWSPDGTQLAIVLSKRRKNDRSNFNIYIYTLKTKQLKRLTKHWAIDTYPIWTPDGKFIVFTSDRSGRPQIYKIPLSGGRAERLTFEGKENDRPVLSPDGKYLAMVQSGGGRSQIAVLDLVYGSLRVVTDGSLDESPSFAPNGSMIIYATNLDNKGVLSAVSVDGRVQTFIRETNGDVREPAWSPFIKQQP
jgi:TolB protein